MTNNLRGDFDLERLVRDYHKPLVTCVSVRIYCFGGRESDAEDIAQEVWLDVSQKNNTTQKEGAYDPKKGAFYTYLLGFAKNKIKQWKDKRPEPMGTLLVRFTEPGMLGVVSDAYSKLFCIVFKCGGYPHEQLSFAFSKHIYGQASSRAIEGSSAKLESKHGDTRLDKLLDEYWQSYISISGLQDEELQRLAHCLEPVRLRMGLKVKELMSLAPAALKFYARHKNKQVARTCLRDYYANSHRSSSSVISDWCYGVEDKVRRVIGINKDKLSKDILETVAKSVTDDKECGRCKLRIVSPCRKQKQGK